MTVNDAGNTGTDPGTSGGPGDEEDTNNVTINITAMNDAPVVGAPGAPLAATEQVGLAVHGTGFTVADADEAGALAGRLADQGRLGSGLDKDGAAATLAEDGQTVLDGVSRATRGQSVDEACAAFVAGLSGQDMVRKAMAA